MRILLFNNLIVNAHFSCYRQLFHEDYAVLEIIKSGGPRYRLAFFNSF